MNPASVLAAQSRTRLQYFNLRASRPDVRAADTLAFVKGELDPLAGTLDQALCDHDWVLSEETDRCYCCYCGMDGDG